MHLFFVETLDVTFSRLSILGTDMKWMPISELQTILHSAGLLQDFSTILQDC